jgi:hypothetical protein
MEIGTIGASNPGGWQALTMTGTNFRFRPSGSCKGRRRSGAANTDLRYSGDSTMIVRSAAIALCISITKLLRGLKSHA